MKRSLFLLVLILLLIPILAGCQCRHEWVEASCTEAKSCRLCGQRQGSALGHDWLDATCDAPKTCNLCGKTEGQPLKHIWLDATCGAPKTCSLCGLTQDVALVHNWKDATCTDPKTCTLCGATEGSALGHSWKDASCTEPKTCNICATTEGKALGHSWTKASCTKPRQCLTCGIQGANALGHSWLDATCYEPVRCAYCATTQGDPLPHSWVDATPEAPKTCTACGLTEGDPIYVDDRYVEEDCLVLFGSWRYEKEYTPDEVGIPGFDGEYVEYITYTFGRYGVLTIFTEVADPDVFRDMIAAEIAAGHYETQANEGRDAAAADAYWLDIHGMTIPEYSRKQAEEIAAGDDFDLTDVNVFYVADGLLHIAPDWEDSYSVMDFSIEGEVLTLTNQATGDIITLTHVIEEAE